MKKLCHGEYPDWGEEEKKSIGDVIKPIAPEPCKGCFWKKACEIREGLSKNYLQILTDEELEAIQGGLIEDERETHTIH